MIAILLTMQNYPETSIKAYWTSKHVVYPFTRHMGLCRFEALLRHVKIYPSTEKETYPRLNEWSSHIQQAMANTYTPGSHVAVDECIQGFTGRSALKTTIPNKPTPVGFKLWALARAGPFLRWIWHVPGKGHVGIKKRKTAESLNPTQQVVVHLLDKLPNAPYHIFLDNLFISPKLFKMLRHKGIGTSGTSRINSGIFSELVDEKKKPDPKKPWGWILTVPTQDGLVNQFAWKDAEIVLFLSTVFAETDTVLTGDPEPLVDAGEPPQVELLLNTGRDMLTDSAQSPDPSRIFQNVTQLDDQYRKMGPFSHQLLTVTPVLLSITYGNTTRLMQLLSSTMSPMTQRGPQAGMVSFVCVRCGEEKPAEDFLGKRKAVLRTPLPPTQQSSGLFRALAPSPPLHQTTHPIVSPSDAATTRSSAASMDHAYLATRYHKSGKDSQDDPSTAKARVKLAAIQRDHRSRRREGETVSLTPTISQLRNSHGSEVAGEGIYPCAVAGSRFFELTRNIDARTGGFQVGDMISEEGDNRDQFSESGIDAEDYANILLSPARPRRYLEQLGIEQDSEPEALFAVGRCSRPDSQGVAAEVPLQEARSYLVDEDVNETIGTYRKYLERNGHEDITYLEYLQSYNLKTWRRLAAQAKKRVLSYFPRYRSMESSPQFNDFCRVKLMMAHPHRSPEELLTVGGQQVDSFAAAYRFCREQHRDIHADDHYGEPDTNELRAEDDEFELEVQEEPTVEEDWHELARMLPDRPLEEEDIDILGRRDIDINYDWTPHIGRYTDDGILKGDYWKQRKAANRLGLDVDHQPLEARDSLNRDQRLVYDTVMDHFLTQESSQLLLHVDGGGGTGKSYLINLLSAHLQAAAAGRGTPVWRAAPTGVAGNQISGTTLHSLLHLPINKDFKPLSPTDMAQLQKKLKDINYLIIDEKSMLGLRQLSWIDDRLREAFPSRNEEFFGSLNILLVGDFFQLPPVLQKPLYYDKEVVQRQRGDDQKAFRTALEELRLLQLSVESWKLLSGRVQAKLDDQEVARFANALRVYTTKDRVNEYNHYHLDRLGRPVIQVKAKNVGLGAAAAPDDKAGNLAKQIPICIDARLMLTSNLWQPVGLCNGARGTVYDIGWAPGADPVQDPPCVIMMEFDKYSGPVFLTTPDGRKIVPILPVDRDFLIGSTLGTRIQFPLIVCYAITVHNSQASLKMSS
ncbi:ATP-dependent DNA helicase PIF1 [Metarhizium guizhouense ARSEF 977]|uniref:ATP-dependent DNA helicase n=1 Tax=Metarhizium guizhouense (strain ARSEF 977) TaxID=1276136 RepID=A0A0B4GIN5_METGA|nr:ATP-dependent DNA helicase PIF1 [Metarhizium guizhouense ARSEF 977]